MIKEQFIYKSLALQQSTIFKMFRLSSISSKMLTIKQYYNFSFRKKLLDFAAKRSEEEFKLRNPHNIQQANEQSQQQQKFTQEENKIINSYKVDPIWNLIIKQPPSRNFQKDLIIYKKQYQKTTQELRSAILFQDLLNTQIDILIYNTKGTPFIHHLLKILYILASAVAAIWSLYALKKYDPKNGILLDRTTQGKVFKYSVYFMSGVLLFKAFSKHSAFCRRYVQKIVYNTQKQQLTFIKRNFFSFKYNYVASRFKILYTQNIFLNKQGTNYFDIDTKQEFSIAYKQSWIKQDLFSHLISQRIKV